MAPRIEQTPVEARSATKDGVGRYVLAISLVAVIVLFVVVYKIMF